MLGPCAQDQSMNRLGIRPRLKLVKIVGSNVQWVPATIKSLNFLPPLVYKSFGRQEGSLHGVHNEWVRPHSLSSIRR